jgi:hypothetical protein
MLWYGWYHNSANFVALTGVEQSAKEENKGVIIKKMKKKVSRSEVTTEVDRDTGEIGREVKTDTFLIDREPDFVKLYVQDIAKLNDVVGQENNVLLEFIRYMGYNNIIPAYKPIKQMIARKLNVSLHTVEKSIKKFKKKGLFISVSRGIYMADPELFGKGKWSDIKNLRLVIEYKPDGTKKLSSNLPEQMQLKLGL